MKWLGPVALIVSILNTIWVWVKSAGSDLLERMDELEDDVDKLDSRVQRVEDEMKHLPTKEMVHDIQLRIAEANGKLSAQEAEMASIGRTVRQIDGYLREQKAA